MGLNYPGESNLITWVLQLREASQLWAEEAGETWNVSKLGPLCSPPHNCIVSPLSNYYWKVAFLTGTSMATLTWKPLPIPAPGVPVAPCLVYFVHLFCLISTYTPKFIQFLKSEWKAANSKAWTHYPNITDSWVLNNMQWEFIDQKIQTFTKLNLVPKFLQGEFRQCDTE